MRKASKLILLLAATLTLGGCSKEEYFNQDTYTDRIESAYPVKGIDASHDWQTVVDTRLRLEMATAGGDTYNIRVYDADPETNATVVLLGAYTAGDGETVQASVSHLAGQRRLWYVMKPTNGGQAYVQDHTIDNGVISDRLRLTHPYYGAVQETSRTFRYLFETSFPEPDDFDYNDIVLGFTCQPTDNPRQVRLTVSIDAIGGERQTAAALHLSGIPAEAIASIETEGQWFDRDNKQSVSMDLLSPDAAGGVSDRRTPDALIYLYNDSHWAMIGQKGPAGDITRPYINTVRGQSYIDRGIYGILSSPRKCTAVITFTDAKYVRTFAMPVLDPFVIVEYNGSKMEVHTPAYKNVAAVFSYSRDSYNTRVPWALLVPGETAYPLEGLPIGGGESGALSGAYQTYGHSFAGWARDHTTNTDWWKYPARGSVW